MLATDAERWVTNSPIAQILLIEVTKVILKVNSVKEDKCNKELNKVVLNTTTDARQDIDESPNIVMGMLRGFKFDVYALLDPHANLSLVTPIFYSRIDIFPQNVVKTLFNIYSYW